MYHRILDRAAAASINPALVSAEPAEFDRQLRHLVRHYRVVSADEVLAARTSNRRLPQRAVLITFDDAYRDFGEIAWPILRKQGLPATVFVSTAYPDHPERHFWWDRLYHAVSNTSRKTVWAAGFGVLHLDDAASRLQSLRRVQQGVKQLPHEDGMRLVSAVCAELGVPSADDGSVLTWRELRSLADDGVTIGGHTRSHAALNRVPIEDMHEEVAGCREDITRALGAAPFAFAYPFGAHDNTVVEVVRQAGFALAFTCMDGHSPLHVTDPLRLHRTNITPRTSMLLFRLRLLRLGALIDSWRNRPYGRRRHHAMAA